MFDQRTSFGKFLSLPFGRYDTLLVSAVIELDLLTLKLVCIIARGIHNLLTNLDASGTFHSRLMGQHLSDAPRDIATLTFHITVNGPSWRYGFSCSICTPSLNFVGIPVRKILHIYCVSISRPGDLWPWNWSASARGTDNLPTNVGVDVSFSTYQPTPVRRITWLWSWRSWRLLLIRMFVLRLCTKLEVRRPSRSEDIAHFRSHH